MKIAAALVSLAGVAASVLAAPTALIQTTASGPTASIGVNVYGSIDRPTKNGTGSKWITLVRVNGTIQEALITGDATTTNLVALDGVTQLEPGRAWATSDRYADINEAGDWAHIGNLDGGATTDDECVFTGSFDGSTIAIAFREGQTIGTGDTLGSANYGPGIQDDGTLTFGWSTTASTSDVSYYGANGTVALLRNGDAVMNAAAPFSTLGFGGRNAFQTTPDGSSWLASGTLTNSSGPKVLVLDGAVVLSVGDVFGGKTISQINGEQNILEANGDWLTRVRFSDGTGGAIKNGQLIAASGDAVGGSVAGETWSELPWTASSDTTFFVVAGDSNGNVALGGFTDNADTSANAVWTWNGQEFMRSGDQIDLDGDGVLDDAYIATFDFFSASLNLGGFLADDGLFYQVTAIADSTGTEIGEALIVVETPGFTPGGPCSLADVSAPFGLIDIEDANAFIAAFGASDPAADVAAPFGVIDIADANAFIAAFLAGCP